MARLVLSLTMVAASALGTVACSVGNATRPRARAEQPPQPSAIEPLRTNLFEAAVGERMRFALSLHGVIGAHAVISVDSQPSATITIRSHVATAPTISWFKRLDERVAVVASRKSGLPRVMRAHLRFGKKRFDRRFVFAPRSLTLHSNGRRLPRQRLSAAEATYDARTALLALRNWQPQPGARASFYSIATKRIWHNVVTAVGYEVISTETGHHRALRIDGTAVRRSRKLGAERKRRRRSYRIWLADDSTRRPLLITTDSKYGQIRIELVAYTRPSIRRP